MLFPKLLFSRPCSPVSSSRTSPIAGRHKVSQALHLVISFFDLLCRIVPQLITFLLCKQTVLYLLDSCFSRKVKGSHQDHDGRLKAWGCAAAWAAILALRRAASYLRARLFKARTNQALNSRARASQARCQPAATSQPAVSLVRGAQCAQIERELDRDRPSWSVSYLNLEVNTFIR